MYCGKYEPNQVEKKHRWSSKKAGILFLSLLLIAVLQIGGTLAYLVANTESVVNTFTPSKVKSEVIENFDGTYKTNVNVTNTGDVDAYIRVKLVTYRVNDNGDHIGGIADIPTFTLGEGWVKGKDGNYYYTKPVNPDEKPKANLTNSMLLKEYDDADGGKQVVEVMAEGIQAEPAKAVKDAWKIVTVNYDGSLTVDTGTN